jgi:hypothetical protein
VDGYKEDMMAASYNQGNYTLEPWMSNTCKTTIVAWIGKTPEEQDQMFHKLLKGPPKKSTQVTSSNGDYTMSAVHGIKKKPHQTQRPRRCRATSRPKITRPRAQKRPMTFDSEDEDEDELVPINKTAALIAASLQPKKKLPRRSN